jgi:hypothetical protein
MSDNMRWRYGDTKPVISKPIAAATKIEIGDLVEQAAGGDVTPAASHAWNTDLATTQNEFHNMFLGVAMQRSRGTGDPVQDSDPIRVATEGVFEFDCAAATFELGTLVAPAKQTGNALENQKVVALAAGNENKAIGRVARRYASSTTRVLIDITSTVLAGGPQAKA